MKKLTGIVRDILCTGLALYGGAAYATVYTDAWTEDGQPASSHNGYITYAYHSAGGIQTMTVNPPEDGDEFIFTGGKLSIMNSSSTGLRLSVHSISPICPNASVFSAIFRQSSGVPFSVMEGIPQAALNSWKRK